MILVWLPVPVVPDHPSNLILASPSHFLVIGLFESWLKPKILDTQVEIDTFIVYRADRIKRDRGGALLYIHKQIPVSHTEKFDDDIC